ncbi:MAG: FAD-binding oxidoreductase, partial [Sulfitobacter sp.]|nr:FAD-binding oxidoreductase [Sulfitobacter sp.]
MQQSDAFWNVTAPVGEQGQSLGGDLTCDVAIVGGGFTGLRAALMLAEAGTDCALFEAGDIANGASGRSGGQVNPMLPVPKPDDLRAAVGPKYFETLAEAALRSADDLFELVERYQIQCEARQKGWLRADHCEAARRVSQENAKLWNKLGATFEFVGRDDVTRMTGAQGYASGTVNTRGGAVQPLALTRGLDRVARAAGAKIFSHAPVGKLRREGDHWILAVNGHRVAARTVIIATNGYTDDLVPGLKRTLLPLTSIQIATEPLDADRLGPLCPEGHTISDTRRLIMYCRREPGGQFIYGGMGYRTPTGGIGGWSWLLKDAPRIFPSLKGVKWAYRWGGTVALTPDRVPHLFEPQSGLICGLGYNGRGVAMSLVMGREMARRALGAATEDLPFPVSSMKPYAFRDPQV